MSYDEEEEVIEGDFKMSGDDEELLLGDMPDMDLGLDEEDPDKDH